MKKKKNTEIRREQAGGRKGVVEGSERKLKGREEMLEAHARVSLLHVQFSELP